MGDGEGQVIAGAGIPVFGRTLFESSAATGGARHVEAPTDEAFERLMVPLEQQPTRAQRRSVYQKAVKPGVATRRFQFRGNDGARQTARAMSGACCAEGLLRQHAENRGGLDLRHLPFGILEPFGLEDGPLLARVLDQRQFAFK